MLKRREVRLRRDYDGLKALICGLVGGPELFAHWERAWREENPGEENDIASDGDGDDEDGSDEEDEKPRKKSKVSAVAAPAPVQQPPAAAIPAIPTIPSAVSVPQLQPDLKRKRGRPRKNAPPPGPVAVPAPPPMYLAQQHQQQQQQQHMQDHPEQGGGGKYLLGIFMLFTFLNPSTSPSSSSSQSGSSMPHKHVGTVLLALNSTLQAHPAGQYVASSTPSFLEAIPWRSVMQYAHALVTILLFLSVAKGLAPQDSRWTKFVPSFFSVRAPEAASSKSKAVKPDAKPKILRKESVIDLNAVLEADDRELFGRALRCSDIGFIQAFGATMVALGSAIRSKVASGSKRKNNGRVNHQRTPYDMTTRAAVVRLAELDLMHRRECSLFHFFPLAFSDNERY